MLDESAENATTRGTGSVGCCESSWRHTASFSVLVCFQKRPVTLRIRDCVKVDGRGVELGEEIVIS